MSFLELAKKRRSHRLFTEEKITEEEYKSIIKAALMSPSSKTSRPWSFVVVDDKDKLQKISESRTMGSQFVKGAAMAIVVLIDRELTEPWIEDGAIASTMMLLQAEDLGLGGCWMQVRGRENSEGISTEKILKDLFDIPEKYSILNVIALGHKVKELKPQNEEKLLWERLSINKYGL